MSKKPTWYFLKKPMKPHCVPDVLLEKIIASLVARGIKPPIDVKDGITQWSLDIPGPCLANRSEHDMQIPGLIVRVPSTDVELLRDQTAQLQLRHEIGVEYYKLHDGSRCLCLTPKMRDKLLKEFDRILPVATAMASAENARINKAFEEGMKKGVLYQAKPRPTGKSGGDA